MTSIILIANESASDRIQSLNTLIGDQSNVDLTIIADAKHEAAISNASLIPLQNDLSQALKAAIHLAGSENIILIDSSLNLTSAALKEMIESASSLSESSLFYAAIENGQQRVEFNATDAESLIELISLEQEWPALALSARKSELTKLLASAKGESMLELASSILIRATTNDYKIESFPAAISLENQTEQSLSLNKAALARTLNFIISEYTIEELFPNHAWKQHAEGSAAASYHSLAALFIRLDDAPSASECIRLSDQFEESPRSLALKGLIAFNRGETLGAVANMVSSLQQYEVRKKTQNHYVNFNPQDLEKINSDLVSGLEALNQRDNETALDFFAQAVFNFDNFYAQYGLNLGRENA